MIIMLVGEDANKSADNLTFFYHVILRLKKNRLAMAPTDKYFCHEKFINANDYPNLISHPFLYSRFTNWFASSKLVIFMFTASHNNFFLPGKPLPFVPLII